MLTLRVDCSLMAGVNAPISVDNLLSLVEPAVEQDRRRVTALRINGVDQPAFRDPLVLTRELADADEVDVETTPADVLAQQALDDAVRTLPELTLSARAVAAALREGAVADGLQGVQALAENLALLTLLVQMADGCAAQAGLEARGWLGGDVARIDQAASRLGQAAADGDWPRAASILDGEMTGALDGWRTQLAAGLMELEALAAGQQA